MKLISPRRKGIMSVIEHLCYTMCPREGTVSDTHSVDLKEILLQLEYNPILSKVLGLKDRFWDLVIIDGLSIITTGTMETGVCCIEKMLIRSRLYLITALHFPIKQQMNRWQHV